MKQSIFANGECIGSVNDWALSHLSDYGRVIDRLETVRNVTLRGRLDAAGEILEKAYLFAVLSIQTDRDRHERAFTAYHAGDTSLKDACLKVVYGGQKYGWIQATQETTDWESLARDVRAHIHAGEYASLLDKVTDNLVGVAHRKGSFMLAMSGLHEYMCIDSNVARYAGLEESASGKTLSFDSSQAYFEACDEIRDKTGLPNTWPPFVVQWAIYDFERGEHARHMAYFREALPRW